MMAISSIISFGFGNGTFDPGVAELPSLGYSQATPFAGAACFTSESIAKPTFASEATAKPSFASETITSC